MLSKPQGKCNTKYLRYTYDQELNKCIPFKYGRCASSNEKYIGKNIFRFQDFCENLCLKTDAQYLEWKNSQVARDAYTTLREVKDHDSGNANGNGNSISISEQSLIRLEELKTQHDKLCQQWNNNRIYSNSYIGCLEEPKLSGNANTCLDGKNILKWSYNLNKNMCEPYTYQGCGGNKNKFTTKISCIVNCLSRNNDDGSFKMTDITKVEAEIKFEEQKAKCFSRPHGNHFRKKYFDCYEREVRYVFQDNECKSIDYKGCKDDTLNFFESKEECQKDCFQFVV